MGTQMSAPGLFLIAIAWCATVSAGALYVRSSNSVALHLQTWHPQVWDAQNSPFREARFGPLPQFILFGNTKFQEDAELTNMIHTTRVFGAISVAALVCSILLTGTLSVGR